MSAETVDAMRELVTFLARSLVDDPDAVEVEVVEGDRAWVLELSVAEDDLGKVIGKDKKEKQVKKKRCRLESQGSQSQSRQERERHQNCLQGEAEEAR